MKKTLKILLLLLIFGLSFQNMSFAVEKVDTSKITKVQLQKKVIISKFILKKELGEVKYKKYLELMDKILEKYGDNGKVLNKLDNRLDDLGKKKLKSNIRILLNFISYKVKFSLFVYNENKTEIEVVTEILEKSKKEEKIEEKNKEEIDKKVVRRSGGGGSGGSSSKYVPPEPIVEPESIINISPTIEDIKKINLSYDEVKTYQVNASDANNDILTYSLKDNPTFVDIDVNTGLITIQPLELDKGQHNFTIVVNDGELSTEIVGNVGIYMKDSDLFDDYNNSTELIYDDLGTVISTNVHKNMMKVPNADGKTWDLLFIYNSAYWTNQEIVVLDTSDGKITKYDRPDSTIEYSEEWSKGMSAVAPNGNLYILAKGRPNWHINIYNPVTNTFTFDAVELPNTLHIGATSFMVLGMDNMLYISSGLLDSEGSLTNYVTAMQINPDTLEVRNYGVVGTDNGGGVGVYGIGADSTHLYIVSGKIPYHLTAVNTTTGTSEVIAATLGSEGYVEIYPYTYGVGIRLKGNIIGGIESGFHYVHNGQISLYSEGIPWEPKEAVYLSAPSDVFLPESPEIDTTNVGNGISNNVLWYRNADKKSNTGTTLDELGWQKFEFDAKVYRQGIHRLDKLSNGNLIGGGKSYAGIFNFDTSSNLPKFLGQLGLSHYSTTIVGDKVYLAGYPSGMLVEYDSSKPWNRNNENYSPINNEVIDIDDESGELNPKFIGYMTSQGGMHKIYSSAVANNGVVYFGGRWMRNGSGGGLAWYNPETGEKGGMSEIFSNYQISDLTTTSDGNYIILSTVGVKDIVLGKEEPKEGRLFVLDINTNEIVNTIDPVNKSESAGRIVGIGGDEVMGIIHDDSDKTKTILYKVNVKTGETIFKKYLDVSTIFREWDNQGIGNPIKMGPDGNIWVFLGGGPRDSNALVKITTDGYFEILGKVNYPVGDFEFIGKDIFIGGSSSLRKIKDIID